MPTTAPIPRSEALKLRSSCDGCGTGKVKCDRGQPECGRCVALGLTCVYGLSRHAGKPPRKRPCVDLDAATSLSCKKRMTTESRSNHTTSGLGQPQDVDEFAQLNFSDLVTDIIPFPCDINNTLSIDEQNRPEPPFFNPISLDEWPSLQSRGPDLEILSTSEDYALESQISASALQPTSNSRPSSDSHEPHSCPRGSYEIFRDLICPSPSLHAPEDNLDTVSAKLDEVLHFNRDATDRLSRLLKCHCAKSGHRVMVHASIISRILIWYQQAAEWTSCSTWEPRPSALAAPSASCGVSSSSPSPSRTAADTGTTSPPTLAQSTGFAVSHVPVSMGIFKIEDQNMQAAFGNQLILSELKKTANLIDLFTSQGSGESSASGVSSLCSHLGVWLRSEHSRIVRILRSRLNTLNESLDC